jgi:predicted HicB family RNase H-like nuclease
MDEQVFVNARFDLETARAARIEAARRGISRSEFVRQAVREMLRQAGLIDVKANDDDPTND